MVTLPGSGTGGDPMEPKPLERKLSAILYADVAGYSRLTGEDEEGTHRALSAHLDVISASIEKHNGTVLHYAGDAVLADFATVSDALICAVTIQRDLKDRNKDISDDRKVQFRVGINLGEVIVDRNEIYGDGVNVAARLESLAEPGGICISESVYTAIGNKLPLEYEFIGEQAVKNIAKPVRAYHARLEPGATLPTPTMRAKPQRPVRYLIVATAMAAMLLIGVGVIAWLKPWAPKPVALPKLSDGPSIAVLPFENLSGDQEQEYFVDGMTDDLITDLSKLSGLFVIARNSVFTYKGKPVKVQQVAEELGVRYILEGSVRRAGEQVRINAQLIDATTGGHLWAERYDGAMTDVFALQDKVTERIVKALAVELTPQEVQRVGRSGTGNVAAHDAYLRGLSDYYRRTPEDNAKAVVHLEKAIQLDPNYTDAYTALAKVYVRGVFRDVNYAQKLGISRRLGYSKAWRLLAQGMAQPNADFHVLRSWLALKKRQHDRAIAEAKRALELSPNDADALEAMAEALIFSGRPKEGKKIAQRALRQNPTLLGRPLYLMGTAEFVLGNADKAVELLERARALAPAQIDFAGILAAAYGELGRAEQAEAAYLTFADLAYGTALALEGSMAMHPFSDRAVLERLANGFKAAGASSVFGYLPLHTKNRLSGSEIKSLLFGKKIKGTDFWNWESWRQQRTADGTVKHFGYPIHVYMSAPGDRADTGVGRIENDMLCEQWPAFTTAFEVCVVIFRIEGSALSFRGDYVMVTDQGPNPFSLVE